MKVITTFCVLLLYTSNIFGENLNETLVKKSFCESQDPSRDVAFIKVGTYRGFTDSGAEYQKTYLVSRFGKADFFGAKTICKSFDLELASFETLTEARTFLDMSSHNSFINSIEYPWIYVDGMTTTLRSTTDWYWSETGKKVPFDIPWGPNLPDGWLDNEFCLTFFAGWPAFNDYPCRNAEELLPFVCQRVDFFTPVRVD